MSLRYILPYILQSDRVFLRKFTLGLSQLPARSVPLAREYCQYFWYFQYRRCFRYFQDRRYFQYFPYSLRVKYFHVPLLRAERHVILRLSSLSAVIKRRANTYNFRFDKIRRNLSERNLNDRNLNERNLNEI